MNKMRPFALRNRGRVLGASSAERGVGASSLLFLAVLSTPQAARAETIGAPPVAGTAVPESRSALPTTASGPASPPEAALRYSLPGPVGAPDAALAKEAKRAE
jgi:hypothetical protein